VIRVETKREGDPARTVAVLGVQNLEFAVPPGGHLEIRPAVDGRAMVFTCSADGKPVGECNVAADSDESPVSVAQGELPS
jgi:hypothetical protein